MARVMILAAFFRAVVFSPSTNSDVNKSRKGNLQFDHYVDAQWLMLARFFADNCELIKKRKLIKINQR